MRASVFECDILPYHQMRMTRKIIMQSSNEKGATGGREFWSINWDSKFAAERVWNVNGKMRMQIWGGGGVIDWITFLEDCSMVVCISTGSVTISHLVTRWPRGDQEPVRKSSKSLRARLLIVNVKYPEMLNVKVKKAHLWLLQKLLEDSLGWIIPKINHSKRNISRDKF